MSPLGPPPAERRIRRRTVLGGALGISLAGAGCGPGPAQKTSHETTPSAPTVASLTATDPFYIAHRGGGGNWPEMTAYAYEQASRVPGLRAMEISVCISSDGVLVCSHDPTTTRLTGVDYTIGDQTWATLSALSISPAETTDPAQPPRPLTRFDDVVDTYINDFVLFVEPKVSPAAAPLLNRLTGLGQPERVVWKQPINGSGFTPAKQQGFGTWGYVLDEPSHTGDNLLRYAGDDDIDLLGAPRAASDAFITAVVAAASDAGKPAISWAIRNVADRDRILDLGCRGLMTSDISDILGPPR